MLLELPLPIVQGLFEGHEHWGGLECGCVQDLVWKMQNSE